MSTQPVVRLLTEWLHGLTTVTAMFNWEKGGSAWSNSRASAQNEYRGASHQRGHRSLSVGIVDSGGTEEQVTASLNARFCGIMMKTAHPMEGNECLRSVSTPEA